VRDEAKIRSRISAFNYINWTLVCCYANCAFQSSPWKSRKTDPYYQQQKFSQGPCLQAVFTELSKKENPKWQQDCLKSNFCATQHLVLSASLSHFAILSKSCNLRSQILHNLLPQRIVFVAIIWYLGLEISHFNGVGDLGPF